MRRVFHIVNREHDGKKVYEVMNLAGKRVSLRHRLNHAREVVGCLDREHTPPREAAQFMRDLVRMKMRRVEGRARPFVIMTYADDVTIKSFYAKWAAKAWLKEYEELRLAKLGAREGSDDDKLIDIVLNKWLISDDSARYGDMVEEAKRNLKAETRE